MLLALLIGSWPRPGRDGFLNAPCRTLRLDANHHMDGNWSISDWRSATDRPLRHPASRGPCVSSWASENVPRRVPHGTSLCSACLKTQRTTILRDRGRIRQSILLATEGWVLVRQAATCPSARSFPKGGRAS